MKLFTEIWSAVGPLIGIIVGAWLAYRLTLRTKANEAAARFKEEKYARLLVSLQGFLGVTTSAALKRDFFEHQYQSWLYSSDDVVRAVNELVSLIRGSRGHAPNPAEGRRAIGEVVLAMRRDLLGKTRLDSLAFQYTDVQE